jgi:hypothetical protein
MPPSDPSPQSRERYFLRLLAVLARRNNGELRIRQADVAEVAGAGARQALFEDFDSKRQEIVLRFGSKLSAVYPFDGDGAIQPCPAPQVSPTAATTQETAASLPQSSLKSRKPLTDSELRDLEVRGQRLAMAARIRREMQEKAKRQNSSDPLDMIS